MAAKDEIASHLAGRIDDLNRMYATIEAAREDPDLDAYEEDAAQEQLDNFALSIDFKITMKVCLSTGGPGDEFEVEIERGQYGWELADTAATYRFVEWFDPAEVRTDDRAVMAYLANIVECISPEWAGE